jgi:excinuclease UvrABC nuclease subunit
MTHVVATWADVPKGPAIYAMYGGEPPRSWVAYVGDAGNLRQRLTQHFVNRDSSVVTGTSAAGLNIDHVTRVDWWEHPRWSKLPKTGTRV